MTARAEVQGVTAAPGTTKARIERAAVALFAEHGVDAVAVKDIAAAAGVSEGALYRHYPSKAALAETLFFALQTALAEKIKDAAARFDAIDDQTAAVVDAYCRAADEDWAHFSYHLLSAHRFLPGADRRSHRTVDNPVAEAEKLIEAAMDAGALPKGEPALKTAMALGAVLQTALHKYYGRISGDLSGHALDIKKSVHAILHA